MVSILVLLDLRFEHLLSSIDLMSVCCFNPCFVGFEVWTLALVQQLSSYHSVSILVLLDLRFEPTPALETTPALESFNPCFVGFEVWTAAIHDYFDWLYQFQSLFCWIWGLNKNCFMHKSRNCLVSILVLLDLRFELVSLHGLEYSNYRFNPCFVGFEVWTVTCNA